MAQNAEIDCRIPLMQIKGRDKIVIEATEAQCRALAQRLGVLQVGRVHCSLVLEKCTGEKYSGEYAGEHILAKGHLQADITQSCVITSVAVEEHVNEHFSVRFVPEDQMPDEAAPLDWDTLMTGEPDDLPHDGRALDLGEAVCQQLALALNPYPRSEGSGLENFVDLPPEDEEEFSDKPVNGYAVDDQKTSGKSGKNEENIKRNPFLVLERLKDKGEMS